MRNKLFSALAVATIDMLLGFATCWMVISLLSESSPKQVTFRDKPVCRLAIDVSWEGSREEDIDTWVLEPGSTQSVGYSQRAGSSLDLVRDDLGTMNDNTNTNMERMCGRYVVEGQYIINVQYFSSHVARKNVPVHVEVSMVDPGSAFMTKLIEKDVVLEYVSQELTVFRLYFAKDGTFLAGQTNSIPAILRPDREIGPQ